MHIRKYIEEIPDQNIFKFQVVLMIQKRWPFIPYNFQTPKASVCRENVIYSSRNTPADSCTNKSILEN